MKTLLTLAFAAILMNAIPAPSPLVKDDASVRSVIAAAVLDWRTTGSVAS